MINNSYYIDIDFLILALKNNYYQILNLNPKFRSNLIINISDLYNEITWFHIIYLKSKYKHFNSFDDYMIKNYNYKFNIHTLKTYMLLYKKSNPYGLDLHPKKNFKLSIDINLFEIFKYYKIIYYNPPSLQSLSIKTIIEHSINNNTNQNTNLNKLISIKKILPKKILQNINYNKFYNYKYLSYLTKPNSFLILYDIKHNSQFIISDNLFSLILQTEEYHEYQYNRYINQF